MSDDTDGPGQPRWQLPSGEWTTDKLAARQAQEEHIAALAARLDVTLRPVVRD